MLQLERILDDEEGDEIDLSNIFDNDKIYDNKNDESEIIIPKSKQERIAIAYILVINKQMKKRVRKAVKLITSNDLNITGKRIRIYNRKFVKTLDYILENEFTNPDSAYIFSDSERISFLQGFFEAKRIILEENENRRILRYCISFLNEKTIYALAASLFEIGAYPYIYQENFRIILEGDLNITINPNTKIITRIAFKNNLRYIPMF
ncbi:hypothetical protein HZA96_06965 [Candidatus Woesearchaeota archaeon]|nr:hypothetical protein [Candidatus Woesearchaeota archaeon]